MKRLLARAEAIAGSDITYLASAGFWMNLSVVAVTIFSIILYIIFGHVVPKEVFGTYQYLLTLGVLITAFSLTGMNSAVIRAVAQGYESTYKQAVRSQLVWGLLPLLVSFAIALYYYVNGNTMFAIALIAIGILSPINGAFNTYTAYLQGKKNFRSTFFYNLAQNIMYYGSMAVAAFFATGAVMLLLVNLVSQGIAIYALHRWTLKQYPPNDAGDPEALMYGKHLSVMGFFGILGTWGDNLLAFHYLGPGALAVYAFATAGPERVAGLLKFLPSAALPKLSTKTPSEIKGAFNKRVAFALVGAFAIAAAYAIAAPWLFTFLFPAYMESVPFSQIYALTIPAAIAALFTAGLTAGGNTRLLYIYNAVVPIIQIGMMWAGVLIAGLMGLIVAKTIASFLALFLAAGLLYFGADASK